MCGIAGILTTDPGLDLTAPLAGMRVSLRHRGPDGEGQVEIALPAGGRLGLVHTRLAILDLSPAGAEPMLDRTTGSCISYNGEVYNHPDLRARLRRRSFHSTGDTETVLHAWAERGEGALADLRGMFAFALYDKPRQQFWLVRDRLGVKPLYAAPLGPTTWLFASEVRALLASGLLAPRLDAAAVWAYLAAGAVPVPCTMLEGVESLRPAEAWRFDLASMGPLKPHRQRYWRPLIVPAGAVGPPLAEASHRLRPVLQEAVGLRTLSDVPLGVFLSGGIDSSALVALLRHQGHEVALSRSSSRKAPSTSRLIPGRSPATSAPNTPSCPSRGGMCCGGSSAPWQPTISPPSTV
jgi:asparagine synthase (glutamine-hydrolysing)